MRAIITLIVCMCLGAQAHAQFLSSEQIIENIPGRWAIHPDYYDPEKHGDFTCQKRAVQIWIGADGRYRSRYENDTKTNISDVTPKVLGGTSGLEALEIFYDGEDRTRPNGELVRWHLIMPDKDTFVWGVADAPSFFTDFRVRCTENKIG